MTYWIYPDKVASKGGFAEDITEAVRRWRQAQGMPAKRFDSGVFGTICTSTAGNCYRVEDNIYTLLDTAGLSATEKIGGGNGTTNTAPAGLGTSSDRVNGVAPGWVKQVVLGVGDSIMASLVGGGHTDAQKFQGIVVPAPRAIAATQKEVVNNDRWAQNWGFGGWQIRNFANLPGSIYNFNGVTGVNTTTDVITTDTTISAGSVGTEIIFSGIPPAPLVAGTSYFIGGISGVSCKVFATRRAAVDGLTPIDLTAVGSGACTITEVQSDWFRDFDRYLTGIRVGTGQQLWFVFEMSSNDIDYNSATPVTGAGSIVENNLIPFMAKVRALYPTANVVWTTPIARTTNTTLNNRIIQFRDYLMNNRASLGIDHVINTSLIDVGGVKIFDPATPSVTSNTTYYLGDSVHLNTNGTAQLFGPVKTLLDSFL